MPLASGFLLQERYCIERVLGHGGMGAVYLATDESLGIPCAVKENLNLSPDSERQFRREASLLASLRHPHLPRVTNHFILGGHQYLVMDYVEGEDLKERLAREHPLPEADVRRWMLEICDALIYLHERPAPVVHRDIKPANIKLTAAGEAMLVDFGIAKSTGSGQKTTTGAVALTPGFAPPEQYGMGRTDGRTDEYALGATMYSLLTGQMPPDSMERLLGNTPLTPPDQLRPGLPPHVCAAIMRALEVKPDDRFESVAVFKAALQGEEEPATAPAPSGRETVAAGAYPTVVRKAPATVSAGGRSATVSAAGKTPTAPAAAKPKPAGMLPWLIPLGMIVGVLGVGGLLAAFLVPLFIPRATATPNPTVTATAPLVTPPSPTVLPTATLPEPTATVTVMPTPEPPTATATPEAPATATPVPPTATLTLEPAPTFTPAPPVGGGGRLAFISNRDGQFYQVYTMQSDGSAVQQLTFDERDKWSPTWPFHGTQLVWSPTGAQLLYVAKGSEASGLDIWLINADGSNAQNISAAEPGRSDGDDYQPAWCQDGTIAFTTKRFNGVPQIATITLENRRPRNTSLLDRFGPNPNEWNVTFFPQHCKRLLLVTVQFGMPEIWQVNPELQRWRPYVSDIKGYNAAAEEPAISPSEKYLVYTRFGEKSKDIVQATMEDSQYKMRITQLTTTGNNSAPQWSSDGKWITFVSGRDGNREIYLMTSAGTDQHPISPNSADDVSPVWQPQPAP